MARYVLPRFSPWNPFVLMGHEQTGYQASEYDTSAIGKKGVVLADLKPGGYILVEGKQHPAISISGYIPKGEEVEIVGGQEQSLMVKKLQETT